MHRKGKPDDQVSIGADVVNVSITAQVSIASFILDTEHGRNRHKTHSQKDMNKYIYLSILFISQITPPKYIFMYA